jgi:lipoprotein signal peptidase
MQEDNRPSAFALLKNEHYIIYFCVLCTSIICIYMNIKSYDSRNLVG